NRWVMTQNSTSEALFHDRSSDPRPPSSPAVTTLPPTADLPSDHPFHRGPEAGGTAASPLLDRLRGLPTDAPPSVWFMRQAGRSLPEYRVAREGTTMLEACLQPDLVAE